MEMNGLEMGEATTEKISEVIGPGRNQTYNLSNAGQMV